METANLPKTEEAQEGGRMGSIALCPPPIMQEESNGLQSSEMQLEDSKKNNHGKLKLIPLIFLIYFEVSGGPSGAEPAVAAAGPFFTLLGFLIFPFVWCMPAALITAELATAYPGNGGFVIWADRAFGPFWGSLMGSWKFLSGAINNGAYSVLCVDYLKRVFPAFSGGLHRHLAIAFFNLVLPLINYTGLTIVGYTAIVLAFVSLLPFILMALISIPKIHPKRWINMGDHDKNWRSFFNTLFWNLNFWDNASALAGEVDHPQRTFPKALFSSGILICFVYLIPLMGAIGAVGVPQDQWSAGFLADAAGMIGGNWLKFWVEVGSVLSAAGLFEAQLSSCSFQLLGMADLGLLPRFVAWRSKRFNTPWVGILITSALTVGVSYMTFSNIIESATFMYGLGMLLEFASFVWLRKKYPGLERPFRVPLNTQGVVCMCLVPAGFLIFVMVIARKMVFIVSGGLTGVGILGFFAMGLCKKKGWMEFNKEEKEVGITVGEREVGIQGL